jgi:hypothetical protein
MLFGMSIVICLFLDRPGTSKCELACDLFFIHSYIFLLNFPHFGEDSHWLSHICHINTNQLSTFWIFLYYLRYSHWIDSPTKRAPHDSFTKSCRSPRRPARAEPAEPVLGPCGSARRNATATVAGMVTCQVAHKNGYITHDDPINYYYFLIVVDTWRVLEGSLPIFVGTWV